MSLAEANEKLSCYFSPKAEKALDVLVYSLGMDRDLAISVLEQLWPEDAIYDVPTDEEEHEELE